MTTRPQLKIATHQHDATSLKVAGFVHYDTDNASPFRLAAPARMVRLGRNVQIGAYVKAGQLIGELDCGEARYLQQLYLWHLENKRRDLPADSLLNEVVNSAQALSKLGFSHRLVMQVRETRQVLDPWPLRAVNAGIITQVVSSGETIAVEGSAFTLAWRQIVCLKVPANKALRWQAPATVYCGQRSIAAKVGRIEHSGDIHLLRIDLLDLRYPLPVGSPVVVELTITPPPTRHLLVGNAEPMELEKWPHAQPPRGRELRKFLHQNGAGDLLPLRTARPAAGVTPQPLSMVAPSAAPPPELAAAELARPGLIMDQAQRARAGIAVATVEMSDVVASYDCTAIPVCEAPVARKVHIKAPCDGFVSLLPGILGQVLLSGDPIGTIESDALLQAQTRHIAARVKSPAAASRSARSLRRLGMAEEDILQLERCAAPSGQATLRAPSACVLSCWQAPVGAYWRKGSALASGLFVTVPIVQFSIGPETLSGLGSPVSVQLAQNESSSFGPTLGRRRVLVTARDEPNLTARIELPHHLVHGADCAAIAMRLSSTADPRRVLTLPQDCIASTAASRQVLVDEGPVLRPRSVTLAQTCADLVEIVTGLGPGERVIRRLPELAGRSRRLTSLLLGMSGQTTSWAYGLDC